MKKVELSVVLATFNEENNIGPCLEAVKEMSNEIIVVDGSSIDRTREIARSYGAKVIKTTNPPIFHINKQKALQLASGKWILQLDADERVSPQLTEEIKKIIIMSDREIEEYQKQLKDKRLFLRHQLILEQRDGEIGSKTGEYAGFFIPRENYFLGKFLRYGGVYPDGVIRLVKKGRARFPCKSVHEQIVIQGKVGWLQNSLLHFDSPTFTRYLERNSRYIDLLTNELRRDRVGKNPVQAINYFLIKPVWWFFMTQVLHKGILDGGCGIIFSFFSALRFPRAYWRYMYKS